MRTSTEILRDTTSILEAANLPYSLSRTGKGHFRVCFHYQGKEHALFLSSSPSDGRALLNSRANVRRKLRELGL